MTEAPPEEKYFMMAYDRDGRWLSEGLACEWKFWNDALWDVCIPEDCAGLTYLDIGCSDGIYPLRFWQRGGEACGVSPNERSNIRLDVPKHLSEGVALDERHACWLRNHYGADYKLLQGGIDREGDIIPNGVNYDIVSCLNVLEYTPHPLKTVRQILSMADNMVIIATDVGDGPTINLGPHPMLVRLGIDDVNACIPEGWELRSWFLPPDSEGTKQGFFCFRRNGFGNAYNSDKAPAFNLGSFITNTELRWRATRR